MLVYLLVAATAFAVDTEKAVGGYLSNWCAARCGADRSTDGPYGCDCSQCGKTKACPMLSLGEESEVGLQTGWACFSGRMADGVGPVYRLSLQQCKDKFQGGTTKFMYYAGSKHCQEYTDWASVRTNKQWMVCNYKDGQVVANDDSYLDSIRHQIYFSEKAVGGCSSSNWCSKRCVDHGSTSKKGPYNCDCSACTAEEEAVGIDLWKNSGVGLTNGIQMGSGNDGGFWDREESEVGLQTHPNDVTYGTVTESKVGDGLLQESEAEGLSEEKAVGATSRWLKLCGSEKRTDGKWCDTRLTPAQSWDSCGNCKGGYYTYWWNTYCCDFNKNKADSSLCKCVPHSQPLDFGKYPTLGCPPYPWVQKTTPDGKRECVIQHAESGSAESVAVVESSKSSFTVEDLTVYAFAAVGLVAVAKVGYSMFPKSTVDYVEVAEI